MINICQHTIHVFVLSHVYMNWFMSLLWFFCVLLGSSSKRSRKKAGVRLELRRWRCCGTGRHVWRREVPWFFWIRCCFLVAPWYQVELDKMGHIVEGGLLYLKLQLRNSWKTPRVLLVDGFYFFLYFHPENWGNDPIWRACFSNGLKPPTSLRNVSFLHMFAYLFFLFNRPTRSIRWGLLIERVRW